MMDGLADPDANAPVLIPRTSRDLTPVFNFPQQSHDLFDDVDMVVAISQQTINDQLVKLVAQGVIKSQLIMLQTQVGNAYTYSFPATREQIPAGSSYIAATVQPAIDIQESGEVITLVLHFTSGRGAFWSGSGQLAQLYDYDMTGWSYAFRARLDLAAVEADEIARGHSVADSIRQQLTAFQSQMFSVKGLFLDFVSADLLSFDNARTWAGGDNLAAPALASFMQFYFKHVDPAANPFVLGYSVTANAATQPQGAMADVPDLLKPTGTAFALYQNPDNPDLSTLNFVLATKGGHGTVSGSPDIMRSSILPQGAAGALAYSHACLLEPLVVQPIFRQIRETIHASIAGNVDVGAGNDYAAAKTATNDGWSFVIADMHDGDDQYGNDFTVAILSLADQVRLDFKGNVRVYKEVSKNCLFCTARAQAKCSLSWSGSMVLTVAGGALKVDSSSFKTDNYANNHDTNSCSDAFSWMGKIVGGIADLFTGFSDNMYFANLLSSALSVNTPGLGMSSIALGALGEGARAALVLPAGDAFSFQNPPSFNAAGDLTIALAYR
jgi:hypothetical protein